MKRKVTVLCATIVTILCLAMLIPSLVFAQAKPGGACTSA